jgi:hypothetical protein
MGPTQPDSPGVRELSFRSQFVVLALFIALAVVHTWPLASAPATLSRNDSGDTVLHEWTIAWVAHQIVRQPLHLFDANIFYPERYTLAYSDHMLVQALMGAPLLWSGASPVLVYNLLLMAGLALTGWTTALLVRRWTQSWSAGILSGSLVAFNALTLTRLPQLQDQHLEFFPLALLALDRLLNEPRAKQALALAGWFVLQALTSGYLFIFTSLSLVAAVAVRPTEWLRRRRGALPYLLLAAVVAAVALGPFLLPYYLVSRDQGLKRSLEEVARYSAHLTDYLATGGRLHFAWWSQRFFRSDALFPGVVALALALFTVGTGQAFRDRRARMALAFGGMAFVLSFGPALPPYRWLFYVFPMMTGIRGAARFGQFALAAVAILAGFGLASLCSRLGRLAIPVCLAAVVTANVEALRAPLWYYTDTGIPPIYDTLKKTGPAVLAFFPFYSRGEIFGNTRYMLASTHFWTPMLNGYSGFAPPSYTEHAAALTAFPDRASLDYLRKVGVNFVVVEGHLLSAPRLARLDAFPELQPWSNDGNLRVFALKQP